MFPRKTKPKTLSLSMEQPCYDIWKYTSCQRSFCRKIYTIHYFEYCNDFSYPGEQHDFWEFQCVDKGTARIQADEEVHVLTHGQIIFHRPNEFHNLSATGNHAPNIVVVSFACNSPCMSFLKNRFWPFRIQSEPWSEKSSLRPGGALPLLLTTPIFIKWN